MTPEEPPRYAVVISDRASADLENLSFYLLRLTGPEYVERRFAELNAAIRDLAHFPGPLSHAVDEEASDLFAVEVRRLLYSGPRGRERTPFRVLLTVVPAAQDEDESMIYVLRVLHGAQSLTAQDGD